MPRQHRVVGTKIATQVFKDGDRVVIVEDVTTAGTSIRETVPILQAAANHLVVQEIPVDFRRRPPFQPQREGHVLGDGFCRTNLG